ncbi:response regulator [Halovivax gelatinilyticus]|uniref:response regulator n=1 Tax=Halovivax gelatinilyticus TaxID=2961597 RepID=UPI0020CA715E|nr:response regulator [Halovivax gelatinilyticus]
MEDNRGDVRLITEGLTASNVESSLTTVTDGEAALEHLTRASKSDGTALPGLVFLDINVPKRTGLDVLGRLSADDTLASISAVVLSRSNATNHIDETERLGADGYFVKPVDPEGFIELIDRIVVSVVESGTAPPGEHATNETY